MVKSSSKLKNNIVKELSNITAKSVTKKKKKRAQTTTDEMIRQYTGFVDTHSYSLYHCVRQKNENKSAHMQKM